MLTPISLMIHVFHFIRLVKELLIWLVSLAVNEWKKKKKIIKRTFPGAVSLCFCCSFFYYKCLLWFLVVGFWRDIPPSANELPPIGEVREC